MVTWVLCLLEIRKPSYLNPGIVIVCNGYSQMTIVTDCNSKKHHNQVEGYSPVNWRSWTRISTMESPGESCKSLATLVLGLRVGWTNQQTEVFKFQRTRKINWNNSNQRDSKKVRDSKSNSRDGNNRKEKASNSKRGSHSRWASSRNKINKSRENWDRSLESLKEELEDGLQDCLVMQLKTIRWGERLLNSRHYPTSNWIIWNS